jgi:hypothetical protein
MMLAITAGALCASTLPADTTVNFNKKVIRIEDYNDQIKVKVYDKGSNSEPYKQLYEGIFSDGKSYEKWTVMEEVGLQLPFLNKKRESKAWKRNHMEPHYAGFRIGYANITNPAHNDLTSIDGMSVKPDQTTEWFINLIEHILPIYHNTLGITTGLGMNWQTFRLDDNTHFMDVNGLTAIFAAPAGVQYEYSRLKVVHLTLPVLLEWQPTFGSNHKSFFSAGVEAGVKTFASSKVKYKDTAGRTIKEVEYKGLNTNPISLSIMAQAGYDNVSIFAKYGLVNVFQTNRGPEVRAVSLGLMLHF